jgi:putative ABC transport system permease protein
VVIVVSIACTIGVLISLLALASGLRRAYVSAGSAGVAIVLSRDAGFEWRSSLPRSAVLAVLDAPGIAQGRVGEVSSPLVSPEFRAQLPPVPGAADGSVQVRGVQTVGTSPAIRPNLRIVSGRMFRAGAQELIIGAGMARTHGSDIGGSIIMPDGPWPIVGTFTDGGSITESDLMGDADTLMATLKRDSYSSITVALDSSAAFERFARSLREDPVLRASAERQTDYLRRVGGVQARYFSTLAFAIGFVMAAGALFACIKLLYASVGARSQEMATLRAMGFARLSVAFSVLAEGALLAAVGALIGGGAAWLIFDGHHASDYDRSFAMEVTAQMVLAGVGWAVALTVLGGILPAMRAARLTVIEVLRSR